MSLESAQELIKQVCYILGFAGAIVPVVLGIFKWCHTPFSKRRKTREVTVLTFFRDGTSERSFPVVNLGNQTELRPVVIPVARVWNVAPGETILVSYRTDNPTELVPEPSERERRIFAVLQILLGILVAVFCLLRIIRFL